MTVCRSACLVMISALVLIGARAVGAQGPPPRFRVSGSPGLLQINTAVAGSEPLPVTNATTTYDVRVGAGLVKKITVQMNAPMPVGVTLTVTLAPPAGATSLGPIVLDATAKDAVVNINNVNSTHAITYQLNATVSAGVVPNSSRTVTLTLVDYP